MLKLQKISIENFKSIRKLENFELKNLNVLIGANGTGKSNFIQFLKLLNVIIQEDLQTYIPKSGGVDSFLYGGQKESGYIYGKLDFGSNHYEFRLEPTTENKLIFAEEIASFDNDYGSLSENDLGKGHFETNLHKVVKDLSRSSIAGYTKWGLESWKVYHFHDTSDTAKVKNGCDINDNKMLRPDASNLAAILYLLKVKYQEYYALIVDTIKLVAPFFQDFILEPDRFNSEKIRLAWKQKGTDQYFNAHHLSDGTLRFICLTTLLMQPFKKKYLLGLSSPATIIIDEPELGLHPYAITILGSMLKSASTKCQIIVSTQSATLLNELDPEDIIVVERQDNQSQFKRLDEKELKTWLDDYSLSELWVKNVFGGGPKE
ncbi:MAG: AAA family ATPase [Candidatus Auribacterota bacterium]